MLVKQTLAFAPIIPKMPIFEAVQEVILADKGLDRKLRAE